MSFKAHLNKFVRLLSFSIAIYVLPNYSNRNTSVLYDLCIYDFQSFKTFSITTDVKIKILIFRVNSNFKAKNI